MCQSESSRGPELVPVLAATRLALGPELPERDVDPSPDLHRRELHVDDLGYHAAALLHLDDGHDVGLHYIVRRERVVDHRVRHDDPVPPVSSAPSSRSSAARNPGTRSVNEFPYFD